MDINSSIGASGLSPQLEHFWEISGDKILSLATMYDPARGSPVYTVEGTYTSRGWTDWTEGFHIGSALLQFDATNDERFLELGRTETVGRMVPHLVDFGVHDHGFNVVSTYGNLWRLSNEGRIPDDDDARRLYDFALRVSGAVQANRWTDLGAGRGFIYSFNGPHSLFVDTIRSLRSLALAHLLGQTLQDGAQRSVSLLVRLKEHALATARYSVYYGGGRDVYDVRGRVAHEALFNVLDGSYRCPGTQQGYSPFSTWTRGLSWAMCGFAEQLEFLRAIGEETTDETVTVSLLDAARATCDFYIDGASAKDGVPYWDTGAPGLARLGDWRAEPADPYNEHEPIDSSAAAIAAQGLLRFGMHVSEQRYVNAALTIASTLLGSPYLSENSEHQGLLLHSVYHRPNGWDHVQAGRIVPCGESSMWGDYHLRELALIIGRLAEDRPLPTFYQGGLGT
jgi:hypothetical protein